jgi:ADP-heptose:LPS heptosyltransferase
MSTGANTAGLPSGVDRGQGSVLIFRLGSIGDTVVALPCFHAIARRFAGRRRILLTNSLTSRRASSAESVLDGTGLVDEVIYYPAGDFSLRRMRAMRAEIRALRASTLVYLAERPDAWSVYRDLAFFAASGITDVVGVPWRRALRACRVDPATGELEYESERLARTLALRVPVSLGPPDWDLRLSPAEHARADALLGGLRENARLMAVAAGAKVTAKDWGIGNWAELLRSLAGHRGHLALAFVGAADEHALAQALAHAWPGPSINLCGVPTPREAAAVLGRCALLVCHDSGPMHLAASQGTPCVALFGSYNRPHRWYPFGAGHRVIHEPRGLGTISVARVHEEIMRSFGWVRTLELA